MVPMPMKQWVAQVESLNVEQFSRTLPKSYSVTQMGGYSHA